MMWRPCPLSSHNPAPPQAPPAPPPEHLMSEGKKASFLGSLEGKPQLCHCDSLALLVNPRANPSSTPHCDELPGMYFKIGALNGKPVYRQEKARTGGGNSRQLFLHYVKGDGPFTGWVISPTLELEMHTGREMLAFAKPETWMGIAPDLVSEWYVPWEARKLSDDFSCMPMSVYTQDELQEATPIRPTQSTSTKHQHPQH